MLPKPYTRPSWCSMRKEIERYILVWWITLTSIQVLNQPAFLCMIQFVLGYMDTIYTSLVKNFCFYIYSWIPDFGIRLIGLIKCWEMFALLFFEKVYIGVVLFLPWMFARTYQWSHLGPVILFKGSVFCFLFKLYNQFLRLIYDHLGFLYFLEFCVIQGICLVLLNCWNYWYKVVCHTYLLSLSCILALWWCSLLFLRINISVLPSWID